ncbi:MAG: type 2 isopentenyl-diphosphate Delta-isomerase [Candidatus Binatia bacterium]
MGREAGIEKRKRSHLELCATGDVEHEAKTSLFEDVELVHDSLSGLDLGAVDTSRDFLGKRLRAPFLITGMTGGAAEAEAVNRDLALVAERLGIGFGLGSQRAMLRRPDLARTYSVRDVAPTALVLANLGLNQAAGMTGREIESVAASVGADAICLHLNPAQELVQPEGDRSFARGLETLRRLAAELAIPLVVKETGCGISASVGRRLEAAGVRYVDVSGAGGTSWVRVEQLRGDARSRALGELFRDWGIPTAASLVQLRSTGLVRIASGGIRNALDACKALALGAEVVGFALPVYRAWCAGGVEAASGFVEELVEGVRVAMVLTGAPTLEALRHVRVVIGPRLDRWREP